MIKFIEKVFEEKGNTWPKILNHNRKKYGGSRSAMRHKYFGIWQPYTWDDYYINVKYLALGLLSLGLGPDDKVIIIGDNAPEWHYAELAVQSVHGIAVGLYSGLLSGEIKYIAGNSEAKFAVAEDQEQVDKFLEIRDGLPLLKKIIYWNYKGLAHYDDSCLIGYQEVTALGRKYDEENPWRFDEQIGSGKADDICNIIYTPGTTGNLPKGAVHTFRTMIAGSCYYLKLDPWNENDNFVPHMPPAWINEQCFGIGCHLLSACTVNFAESPETQQKDAVETGPSIIIRDARLWESQASGVKARILTADTVKRFFYDICMPAGYRVADYRFRKETPGLFNKIIYFFSYLIIFRPIKKSLGLSNARICYSTGSILSPEAFRFYHALKLPLKSIYGSTEGGFITGAGHDEIKINTVGPAHRGVEVRVSDDGEFVYRHPGLFIGYYRDEGRTSDALKDGWFYSGDRASIEDDGHIILIDRLNDIVELSDGTMMAPQYIECLLRSSPYIKDAWVTAGREKNYPSAVIIINYTSVSRWAGQNRLSFHSFADLSQRQEIYNLIGKEIKRINRSLSPGMELKKFVNLHKEFEPDEGELTRTMKLRRTFLENIYMGLVDAVYSGKTEFPIVASVRFRDGHVEKMETNLRIDSAGKDGL